MIAAAQETWARTDFTSVWSGPDIELVIVQGHHGLECWKWTARGWREPDDCDDVDKCGWVWAASREAAEKAALQWYLAKE